MDTRIGRQGSRGQGQIINIDEEVIERGPDEYDRAEVRDDGDDSRQVHEGVKALPSETDLEVLQRIFLRTSDGKIILNDSRLGQNSQRDFVKRLTVLFLLLHTLEGQKAVPRTELNAILADAKVYDNNARSWINGKEFIEKDGESVLVSDMLNL